MFYSRLESTRLVVVEGYIFHPSFRQHRGTQNGRKNPFLTTIRPPVVIGESHQCLNPPQKAFVPSRNNMMLLITSHVDITLSVQVFRRPKKQPLPIQRSRPLGDSQEPKTNKKIQFDQVLFQKITFLYFLLYKSWIWRRQGHVVNNFSY